MGAFALALAGVVAVVLVRAREPLAARGSAAVERASDPGSARSLRRRFEPQLERAGGVGPAGGGAEPDAPDEVLAGPTLELSAEGALPLGYDTGIIVVPVEPGALERKQDAAATEAERKAAPPSVEPYEFEPAPLHPGRDPNALPPVSARPKRFRDTGIVVTPVEPEEKAK